MDQPRVVIVGPWWRPLPPVRDGAPEWVIEHTVRRLPTLRPLVVSPWHPDLEKTSFDRSQYRHVRPGWLGRVASRIPYRLARRIWGTSDPSAIPYVQGLRPLLRRLQPDVVVTHVLPGLALLAREAVPRSRVVHYSHTNDLQDLPTGEWERWAGKLDGLITVCGAALETVEARFGPLPWPARIIRNGVDLQALRPENRDRWRRGVREELGLGEGPVAVFCGRLHPRKGADALLHAFRQVREARPDAQLLVVGASTHMARGADSYSQELAALAERCGPGAVRFSGYVPSPLLGRVLAAGDVGVLPSVEQEGMPLSILEFAACGMPVVASRVGGVPEVIRDGCEGFLIERERVASDLTVPLLRLMTDAALREKMGRAARQRVEAEFGWERVAVEFEQTLLEFRNAWAAHLPEPVRGDADVRDYGSAHPSGRSPVPSRGSGGSDGADAPARPR